jgi:hypothetical protein
MPYLDWRPAIIYDSQQVAAASETVYGFTERMGLGAAYLNSRIMPAVKVKRQADADRQGNKADDNRNCVDSRPWAVSMHSVG